MKKPDMKSMFQSKNVRFGGYSTMLIGLVVIIAIVLNLIASQLPETVRTVDLTPGNLYSIGSKTEKMLDGLDQDVDITVLAAKDTVNETLNSLLKEYESASKHIKVTCTDPTVDITMANQYSNLSPNSLIVRCGSKETTIDTTDIFVQDYMAYYSTGQSSREFDGEGQITSAIAYVTSTEESVLYSITGHGESAPGDSLMNRIEKQNLKVDSLNLMTASGIPEDCDILLIYAPTMDYTEEEAQTVIQYFQNGGHVLALISYTEEPLPNYRSILETCGVQVVDGIVIESMSHYAQYPPYVLATIDDTEITQDLMAENSNILMPNIQGLTVTEPDGLTVTPLLSSSGGAFSKQITGDTIRTFEREDGDVEGPFEYAVLAETADASAEDGTETGTSAKDAGGSMIVISGASLIDENITQAFALGNVDFFLNCLSYLDDRENSQGAVSIDKKSLDPEYIAVPTMQISLWALITIILLPLAVFITGLVVWIRRRHR